MADDIRILGADVVAFLTERNVSVDCERCGQNNWETSDEQNKSGGMGIVSTGLTHWLPCVPFHCKNCGHVRLVEYDIVANWKRKKMEAANG